jgi:hypothetical protein
LFWLRLPLPCRLEDQMSAPANPKPQIRHPEVQVRLTGIDGNAYAILGAVRTALRAAGHTDEVAVFLAEATSGDYAHLLTGLRPSPTRREVAPAVSN